MKAVDLREVLLWVLKINIVVGSLALLSPHYHEAQQRALLRYTISLSSSLVFVDTYALYLFESTAAVIPSLLGDAGALVGTEIHFFNNTSNLSRVLALWEKSPWLAFLNPRHVIPPTSETCPNDLASMWSLSSTDTLQCPISPDSEELREQQEPSSSTSSPSAPSPTSTPRLNFSSTPVHSLSSVFFERSVFSLPWLSFVPALTPCNASGIMILKYVVYFLLPFPSIGLWLGLIPLSNTPAIIFDFAALSPLLCWLQYMGMTRAHPFLLSIHSAVRTVLVTISVRQSGFVDEFPGLFFLFLILLCSRLRLQPFYLLRLLLVLLLQALLRPQGAAPVQHHHRPFGHDPLPMHAPHHRRRVLTFHDTHHGEELHVLPPRVIALLLQRALDAVTAWEAAGLPFTSTDISLLFTVSGRLHDVCEAALEPFVAPSFAEGVAGSSGGSGDTAGPGSSRGRGGGSNGGVGAAMGAAIGVGAAAASRVDPSLLIDEEEDLEEDEERLGDAEAHGSRGRGTSTSAEALRAPSAVAASSTCVACLENTATVTCYPCGHTVLCQRCFEILDRQAAADAAAAAASAVFGAATFLHDQKGHLIQCALCRMYVRRTRSHGLQSLAEYHTTGMQYTAEAVARLALFAAGHQHELQKLSPKARQEFARLGVVQGD